MTDHSYTTGFTVPNSPAEVFAAVNDVRGWWNTDVQGPTDVAGESFEFEVPGVHYSKIEVRRLVPGELVEWYVAEARITFVRDQSEWVGTMIRFEITETDERTRLTFTHNGLVPAAECYDACSNAWGMYVGSSLRELILTGTGRPGGNPEEQVYKDRAAAGEFVN